MYHVYSTQYSVESGHAELDINKVRGRFTASEFKRNFIDEFCGELKAF